MSNKPCTAAGIFWSNRLQASHILPPHRTDLLSKASFWRVRGQRTDPENSLQLCPSKGHASDLWQKCLARGCWGGFLSKMSKNWKLCELFISCFAEFLKKGVSLSRDLHCFCLFSQEASFLTVSRNNFFSSRVDFRSIWLLFPTPCCSSLPTQFWKKRPARRLCA